MNEKALELAKRLNQLAGECIFALQQSKDYEASKIAADAELCAVDLMELLWESRE